MMPTTVLDHEYEKATASSSDLNSIEEQCELELMALEMNDTVFKDTKYFIDKKTFLARINKNQEEVKELMKSAPFWRTADKFGFVLGTTLIITYSFMLGRYPYDLVYTLDMFLLPVLIITRCFHYYSLGWHYYISDFCYTANALILYFFWFDSRNEQLF